MGRESRLNPGRRVVLGYPCGGSVTLPFHASCLRLLGYELGKPEPRRILTKITHASGLYVADNRATLTEQFLAAPGDWLLQIDTDIEFPHTLLETLLELAGSGKKILAASVPLGAYASCAFMKTVEPGVWEAVHPVPAEPIPVDGIATAVALVHREVFEAIAAERGPCWWDHMYLPGTRGRSVGEDLAFSIRAAEAGYQSWAVTVPGIGHYKVRRLTHDAEQGVMLETPGLGVLVEA